MDFLATIFTRIDQDAKTAFRVRAAAFVHGQLRSQGHDLAHQRCVRWRQLRHRRNVRFGNHQKMHWRPRIDVIEGDDLVVFIDDLGWDFASDNFAENTVGIVFQNAPHIGMSRPACKAENPLTMRTKNQIDTTSQATQPGHKNSNHNGAVNT